MSFEQGATLSNVVNQVGREVWGDKFSQYRAEQQQQAVLKYLKTQPSLLIWDNFEPVAGFPAGNEPLLNSGERDSLQRFLKDLRGGKSWVLITSRREERWLDCGYRLVELRGLREQDVEELAAKILQTAGVDRAKLSPEYLELLKLLGGHPFSLRVVLPHLKTQQPKQLIEALRQGLDTLDGTPDKEREKSLAVSLDYSFANLSERARRHLPFLALFSERVDADWLHAFSSNPDDEDGQAYQAFFGENLQKADWLGLLNEAAEAGILEHLDSTIYKIHPALPWYLRQRLSEQHAAQEVSELEKKLLVFYTLLAENYREELIGNAELASFVLRVEEPNLLQNLRLAQQQQSWVEAHVILAALGEVYERIGRQAEFRTLRQRVLSQIGIHLTEAKAGGQDAFNLWIYLQVADANEALAVADLEGARAIYQEILDELTSLNDPSVNDNIAVAYQNLGVVAQKQRHFDKAVAFYQKALQIFEDAGDLYKAAGAYHQLGSLAQEQQHFDEAVAFYQKALQIFEDAGDLYKAASGYHQLGSLAQEQRQFDEAKAFYYKALQIKEDAGNLYKAAHTYHQLGSLAQEQRCFDKAVVYYHKSLHILEDVGNWYKAATNYHQLGRLAQEQRHFDDALAYYHKSLHILEDVGDLYKAAGNYHQLGRVAQEQRRFDEAIAFYQKALQIYEDAGDFYNAADEYHNLGMVAQQQRRFEEATAFYQKALQIFEDAGDFYNAALVYHNLGVVAQQQRRFDEATAFYNKAFEIRGQFQDWRKVSSTLSQWGNLLEIQENWAEALQIYIHAFAINLEHNEEWIGWDIRNLGRMLKVMETSQFESVWQQVTGEECPEEVRSAIQAASEQNEE
jgi:tetratricopeptide (TPR) repeat protein